MEYGVRSAHSPWGHCRGWWIGHGATSFLSPPDFRAGPRPALQPAAQSTTSLEPENQPACWVCLGVNSQVWAGNTVPDHLSHSTVKCEPGRALRLSSLCARPSLCDQESLCAQSVFQVSPAAQCEQWNPFPSLAPIEAFDGRIPFHPCGALYILYPCDLRPAPCTAPLSLFFSFPFIFSLVFLSDSEAPCALCLCDITSHNIITSHRITSHHITVEVFSSPPPAASHRLTPH